MRFFKRTFSTILEALYFEEELLYQKEEALLFYTVKNPAIVLGLSLKVEEWVDLEALKKDPLPLIRRFTGGGAVIIDEGTIQVTVIKKGSFYPEEILSFLAPFYAKLGLVLIEKDFTYEGQKVGGNALRIKKGISLTHTSLIWTIPKKIELLLPPPKMPLYRKNRDHKSFLKPLKELFSSKEEFMERLFEAFRDRTEINCPLIEEKSCSDFEDFFAAGIALNTCKEKSSKDEQNFP